MSVPAATHHDHLLTARALERRHGGFVALSGVDVTLDPGESVALLGSNGAGKTTLLELLARLRAPDAGSVAWRPGTRVGWVPQRPAVYRRLSSRENLRLFAALEDDPAPRDAAEALLHRADLQDVADRRAHRLSTGTLQRLNIAVALAGRPAALLLDEPTATLSPDQRERLWEWIARLRADDGLTVLFSTQSVTEAIRHAGRMLVVHDGRGVFDGTGTDLLHRHGRPEDAPEDAGQRAFMRLLEAAG